jgi:DNA-binding GntR family transcriptional regulator
LLTKTYREINARVQSLRFRTNQNAAKWQRAVKEHELMLAALEARDAPALKAVLVEHLLRKRDAVVELMRAGQAASRPLDSQQPDSGDAERSDGDDHRFG